MIKYFVRILLILVILLIPKKMFADDYIKFNYSVSEFENRSELNKNEYDFLSVLLEKSLSQFLNEKEIKIDLESKTNLIQKLISQNSDYFISDFPEPKIINFDEFINTGKFILNKSDNDIYINYSGWYNVVSLKDGIMEIIITLQQKNNILNRIVEDTFTFKITENNLYQMLKDNVIIKISGLITGYNYYKITFNSNIPYFIEINNVLKGRAPGFFYVREGIVKIKLFEQGYIDHYGEYNLENNIELNIELKERDDFGYLNINTFPLSAQVSIDNKYIGNTPFKKLKLVSGEYLISIFFPGYEISTIKVKVESGESVNIEKMLFPEGTTEFYNKQYDNLISLGSSSINLSYVFMAGTVASYLFANNFFLSYINSGNPGDQILYYSGTGIGIVCFSLSVYYLIKGLIDFYNAYDMIKEDDYTSMWF